MVGLRCGRRKITTIALTTQRLDDIYYLCCVVLYDYDVRVTFLSWYREDNNDNNKIREDD